MVALGLTVLLPAANSAAAIGSPPGSSVALVAPLVVHRSVTVSPASIWNGSAARLAVIPGMTVTLPPSPTAVSV